MSDSFLRKKFIFNEVIDSEYLFSLYEDDFGYIEEIFKTTLDQLTVIVRELPGVYAARNATGLRKLVHKIKPAFGFTGFLETEKACQQFEDHCNDNIGADDLAVLYVPFSARLTESMEVMQKQYDQLKEFNKS